MPSKRDAQLVSDGSSDKKVKEATSQVDTKEEVIAAQLQALEHIKRIRDLYQEGIVKLRERAHRKKVALSHLRVEASLEDSTRMNLSKTYDQIRILQFDVDNLVHKVAEEKAKAPDPSMVGLVLKTIETGFAQVQADLQQVKQRLNEVDKASRESIQATLSARDDIVTEIQRSTIDERLEVHSVLAWDDT